MNNIRKKIFCVILILAVLGGTFPLKYLLLQRFNLAEKSNCILWKRLLS